MENNLKKWNKLVSYKLITYGPIWINFFESIYERMK